MKTPAIFAALLIARKAGGSAAGGDDFMRHVAFNGSIVVPIGAFVIGAITGHRGMTMLKPFILDAFLGFLCFFLLDMGTVAGRVLQQGLRHLTPRVCVFSVGMPLIGATLAQRAHPPSAYRSGARRSLRRASWWLA
jgi:hypothetical protein